MKKKLQRYLAGEREGFSLVELIIVIAIMAILIGVVALAVLPNIAKSKESKDIAALDSILSALNSAVASKQVSDSGYFTLTNNTSYSADTTNDPKAVGTEVMKLLGKDKIELTSANIKADSKIKCSWTFTAASGSTPATQEIKVQVVDASGNLIKSEYNGDNGFELVG